MAKEETSHYLKELKKDIARDLQCFICLDILVDPVLLPCMHSCCRLCAHGLYRNAIHGEFIFCPVDRSRLRVRLEELPTNRQLSLVLHKLLTHGQSPSVKVFRSEMYHGYDEDDFRQQLVCRLESLLEWRDRIKDFLLKTKLTNVFEAYVVYRHGRRTSKNEQIDESMTIWSRSIRVQASPSGWSGRVLRLADGNFLWAELVSATETTRSIVNSDQYESLPKLLLSFNNELSPPP